MKDDVHNIQRMHAHSSSHLLAKQEEEEEEEEEEISEKELKEILDRKGMFEGGGLNGEGKMYDLVVTASMDLFSGLSN